MMISRYVGLAAAIALASSGCTLLFDPDRLDYVDDAGPRPDAGQSDAGGTIDGGTDAGPVDAGPLDAGPLDAGTDAGPPPCGQIGEACCAPPRPACAAGTNCTVDERCEPCGGPGQECCRTGAPCQVLSCLDATDRCPAVTPLVQVPVPGGDTYGIDAYEVSREQYEAWLATNPTLTGALVATGCGGNAALIPDATCLANGYGCTGATCARHPQTCIDWCDAFAYCAAVGKQLCGSYGPGSVSSADFDDPSRSAWYNACSSGGLYEFSPGVATGVGTRCQFMDLGEPREVDALAECQSPETGYEGVLALTGNVREWVNSCDGITASAQCLAVGGAYLDNDHFEGQCNYPNSLPRNLANASTGFRCCELP